MAKGFKGYMSNAKEMLKGTLQTDLKMKPS